MLPKYLPISNKTTPAARTAKVIAGNATIKILSINNYPIPYIYVFIKILSKNRKIKNFTKFYDNYPHFIVFI